MQGCSKAWFVALIAGTFVVAGCQSWSSKLRNPFAKKPAVAAAPQLQAPGSSITQTGFEQAVPPSGSQYTPAPGASLEGVKEDKDTWQKVQEAVKTDNIARQYKKMVGRGPNEAVARQAYIDGESAFRTKKFDEAAKKFAIAVDRWPDSILEEDAMFMQAESLFFADRYSKASDTYVALLKKFENSRYLDKITLRMFALGQYWDELSKHHYWFVPNFTDKKRPLWDAHANAMAEYEAIRMNDPTGPLADDAAFAAGVSYFLQGKYEDADYHFDTVRKEYPRSEHQAEAHLLGLRAKLRNYQGSQYDERPLLEADKLIDSTLRQYSQEFPDERERLQRAQRAIRGQKAEREYENGEYYYRRKCYGAAKFHYNALVKQYPDTPHAKLGQDRLIETKDYPDDPPDYWGWLGKLFGERDRRTY